ncbi:kinesin motor domain protein [Onchocerca flexuosa]|uniref:Kinesin motor domain protein n=2 Tax=Onchocerca flexuosa TaxID=387005 RepID=A0A238BM82_9BILA|nr:kinesin motor domain protein [Onchocerca flexuosa]
MRPPLPRESEAEIYWKVIDDNTIVDGDEKSYTFDQVYREVDLTQDVYDNSAKDVVESAMAGYNGTLFAYGQTASGKTYTMFGMDNTEGIVQMALDTIFAKILEGNGKRYLLRMSCIEIYNEKVRDLLSDSMVDLPVSIILANRVIGETALNERSSRSHVILRFVIECHDDDVASGSSYVSFLNVVDLAGSESAKRSGGDGDRLKESGKINTSLLALQKVINQLSEKGHGHVNFRDSKLTRLLKNSLGGNARTLIICTASPTEVTQTLQTLRFAARAKKIKNKPRKNWNAEGLLTQYIQTIERLKAELEENRKNETIELELMNKNIELSKEVQRLKKCILSSQMLPQPTQKYSDRHARRQTWGGNWVRPGAGMLLPYRNSDIQLCELDSDETDIATDSQTSNKGSNQMSGTESTVIKTADDAEDPKPTMTNYIAEDIKLPTENCLPACPQEINEDESPSCGEKEDIDSKHSSLSNEFEKEEVIGLEAAIAELKAENEYLKEELRCRNRDIGWLEKQCDDADNKETELREQIYETQKIYDENLSVIAELRDKIAQMKNSMMTSDAADICNKENLFRLENEIKKKEKEMREMKGEIASKDRKISGLLLELRRVMNKQENTAEKARFGENDNDNLSSKQIICVNAQMNQKNRYEIEIDSLQSTPVKNPECITQ